MYQVQTHPPMQYVVINLDRSPQRLASVSAQFTSCAREFRRFAAISDADPATDPIYDGLKFERLFGRTMRKGELGCFKSHVSCLQNFLAGPDETIVILEDDTLFEPATFAMIEACERYLRGVDWHCVNLSNSYDKRFSVVGQIEGRMLRRSWQFPLFTSALLWSRAGAALFLKDVAENGIYAPVDDQLRYVLARSGRGYAFNRPIVQLADFGSDIDMTPSDKVGRVVRKTLRQSLRKRMKRMPIYIWSSLRQTLYGVGLN